MTKILGTLGKPYAIQHEIGRGSFGTVYLVTGENGQNYALKFLYPIDGQDVRVEFEAEIKSVIGLEHPNIIKVIDYGECKIGPNEGLFVVSEYCPNGNYKSKLQNLNSGTISIESAVANIKQLLAGLKILHSKIVHRDLKPENIFVSGSYLKLADFGLAKFVDEATRTLTFKGSGTPRYMAPEIWQNRHATPAADLYSLGVIFFEALTGKPPFSSQDLQELRKQHLFQAVPRPKDTNPQVPDKIDSIIKKLLYKEPAKRFQSAEEVLAELDAAETEPNSELSSILNKARKFSDTQEAERSTRQIALDKQREEWEKNKYKENEVIELVAEVVEEFNKHMPEAKITGYRFTDEPALGNVSRDTATYNFGGRSLTVHFFSEGELYRNPKVLGRMKTLTDNFVVHGGYIEIKQHNEDREGWNLYLTRTPGEMYGEWFIVETDLSALSGKAYRYPPMATEAQLFADNLSCHLGHAMHVYTLKSKKLERSGILKILEKFIPS